VTFADFVIRHEAVKQRVGVFGGPSAKSAVANARDTDVGRV
jgi:hypothetical protein